MAKGISLQSRGHQIKKVRPPAKTMADQQDASSSRVEDTTPGNNPLIFHAPTTSFADWKPQAEVGESPPMAAQKKCASCSKPETVTDPDEQPVLKACSKCHTTLYCSRDCTKSDFKQHKKVCAKQAQAYAESAEFKPIARRAPPKENFRGGLQKWQFDT